MAILFRLIAFGAMPELSDDFYRFFWDGQLMSQGVGPFERLPSEYSIAELEALGLSPQLREQLNSPDYYSLYPPVCQAVFWVAASLAKGDVVWAVWIMKAFFLLAEALSMFFLYRLIKHWNLPRGSLALYALNPLVIVELTGNVHFEAFMICFLLWSIYALTKGRWLGASIPFALSVCSKLLPLMLLPLLLRRLGFWRATLFSLLTLALVFLAFLPVMDLASFLHLGQSVRLYFETFEFNASIYHLLKEVGAWFYGYPPHKRVGRLLAFVVLIGIGLWVLLEKKTTMRRLPDAMLWIWLCYLLLARIIHPWYITPLVALSVMTRWRFAIIWSLMVILTYSAYMDPEVYQQNYLLVTAEYLTVLGAMIFEWKSETQ